MNRRACVGLAILGWLCVGRAALAAAQTAPGPDACAFPRHPLSSTADTAAFCAAQFVARNGYTDLPATTDSTQVVYEITDLDPDWHHVVQERANTLERHPFAVCAGKHGYLVLFRSPAQADQRTARVVTMTRRYHDVRLVHQLLVLSPAKAAAHACTSSSAHGVKGHPTPSRGQPDSQLLPTSGITHSGGAPREYIAPASPRPLARSDAGGRTPR